MTNLPVSALPGGEQAVIDALQVITASLGMDARQADRCIHVGKVYLARTGSLVTAIEAGEDYAYTLTGTGNENPRNPTEWRWLYPAMR